MKQLLAIMFLLLTASGADAATFDPDFTYRTIETEHFQVHYHQGLEALAGRAATVAEEVHRKLSPLLGWNPAEKTNLVLSDNSDFANGMATAIPWNTIYLQTVPPAIMSTIGEYDDWLRILIIHEYAHILTSDPVRGYSKVLRGIFGKTLPVGDLFSFFVFVVTAPPNVLMPSWWHEGMATWSETELSSSGRGRSSFYEMVFRTAVAEKNLPSIDLINGDVPYWPAGSSPYIFGSRLVQYMAATYGKEKPGSISIQQSGRVPYFINGAPEDQLEKRDYQRLYREMISALTKEQEAVLAKLGRLPFTKAEVITRGDAWETSPRFSADGKMIAFNRDDRHNHRQTVIKDLHGQELASFRRQYGDGALSWSRDGSYLYLAQAELEKNVNVYQDIYRYDIQRDRLSRLTCGLRAGEPDISPDGKTLAVIVTGRGSQNLALLDVQILDEGKCSAPTKVISEYKEFRVASPRWSPDGKSIAYTVTDNSGNGSLNLYLPATGEKRILHTSNKTVASPAWSRDGKELFFSTDDNGVFNIFAFSLENGRVEPKTNLISGGFSPDISADGAIALSLYSSRGFRVALVNKENLLTSKESYPDIYQDRYPVVAAMVTKEETKTAADTSASTPYSPWKSLAPGFWIPSLIADGPDDLAIGALTAGQDILGYHTVLGSAWYGTGFHKGYFDAFYQYGRFTPSLTLQGYALPIVYGDLFGRGDYTEMEKGFIAKVSLPLLKLESGFSLAAGYHLRDQTALTPLVNNRFNGIGVFQGRRDSFFAGLDYASILKYPWSISHEEGRTVSGRVNYFGKASGSEINAREYTLFWTEYLRLPGHQALMARLNLGMAEGEQTAQQSFQIGGSTSQFNPFGVRGYASRFLTGSYVATGTAEYRFPIQYLLKGASTKPVFFDRLHGAIFADAGEVWDRERAFRGDQIKVGAGAELRMDLTIGYWLKITPSIGYAHGFDHDGEDQIYFNIYANL